MSTKQRSRSAEFLFGMAFYVLAFSWIALTYGGWVLISTPETGKHSHLIGWAIVTVCGALMVATVDHWAKYLTVLLGGGILGGRLILSNEHLLKVSRPFPRATAAAGLERRVARR